MATCGQSERTDPNLSSFILTALIRSIVAFHRYVDRSHFVFLLPRRTHQDHCLPQTRGQIPSCLSFSSPDSSGPSSSTYTWPSAATQVEQIPGGLPHQTHQGHRIPHVATCGQEQVTGSPTFSINLDTKYITIDIKPPAEKITGSGIFVVVDISHYRCKLRVQ